MADDFHSDGCGAHGCYEQPQDRRRPQQPRASHAARPPQARRPQVRPQQQARLQQQACPQTRPQQQARRLQARPQSRQEAASYMRPVDSRSRAGKNGAGMNPRARGNGAGMSPRIRRGGGDTNSQASRNGSDKKKGGLWRIVFWAALAVFALSLAVLGFIGFSYWQGQHNYDKVAEQAFGTSGDIEGTTLSDITVDWEALWAINPDVVGWVYVPGTIVNYPVLYSGDDKTYLTRDIYGNEGGWWMADYGAVFLSGMNKSDFSDKNNIIYGHNLLNGSMFADLAKLTNQSEFDAHRTVYLLTPKGNYRLTAFADVNVSSTDPLAQVSFSDDDAYTAYVQDKIDRSTVVPQEGMPSAEGITQTFAFSTCDHDHAGDMRYVLFCTVAEYAPVGAGGAANTGGADVVDPDAAAAIEDASKEIA